MTGSDASDPAGDPWVSPDAVTGPIPYVAPRVEPTASTPPTAAPELPLPVGVRAWGSPPTAPPEPGTPELPEPLSPELPEPLSPEPPATITAEPPELVTPEPPVAIAPEPPVAVTAAPVAAVTSEPVAVTPRVLAPASLQRRRRRTLGLVGAGALAVIALALVLIFGLTGGAGKQHAPAAPSATAITTGLQSPTGSAQPTGPAIDPALARQLIVRYLNDVNTRNRADGQTLICAAKVAAWRSSIDQSRGDFTVDVIQATFQGSTASPTGLDLKYSLQITTAGTAANTSVTFTVIDENGLKICGEA